MISRESAVVLVSLLSNEQDSLSDLYSKFVSSFDVKHRMTALYALSLLAGDQLLDHGQQIVATWLLFSEFQGIPIIEHPFFTVFTFLFELRKVDGNMCPPQLFDILSVIISGGSLDKISSASVQKIMSPEFSVPPHASGNISLAKQERRMPPVLVEPKENPKGEIIEQTDLLIELLSNDYIYTDFEPQMARPVPSVSPVFAGELESSYVSSYELPPGIFDEFVSINSRGAAISMIRRAVDGKIKPAEVEPLSIELEKSPDLALEADLSVDQIERMIETCPTIAIQMFRIVGPKKPELIEYLSKTIITDATADVARAVLTVPSLPDEYIDAYVNGQIKAIQTVRDQQTYVKKISLFCKMLADVVNDGISFNDKLLMDLYSFCVERKNEPIKEARELKTLLGEV